MEKKNTIFATLLIFFILVSGICVFYIFSNNENIISRPSGNNITNTQTGSEINENNNENSEIKVPTEGNDNYLETTSKVTLRVINEYDKSFFTKDKNLLIMFASWCPNCKEEISEIEKILNYYKDNKNVSIILIAHEYEQTIQDLTSLVENDVDFGNTEIKIDLKRIIRKTIDPEASTIPISYVVDKNGKVLNSYNDSLTLEKAKEMLK